MIYTSSYKDSKTKKYRTVSISKDKGRDAEYEGDYDLRLAPLESFFRIWKNNRGVIPEKENTEYYINEFYYQVLKKLNPEEIYKDLDNSILLCYEDNTEFCHRHLVAAWFELFLGVEIKEVKVINDEIEEVEKPEYIKEMLEKLIKEDLNINDSKILIKKNLHKK